MPTKNKEYYKKLLANPKIKAALDTIAKAEGVKYGYNTLYGNTRFDSLASHPKKLVTKWGITSSAAGRYQFLAKTWDNIAKKLNLDSFSAENQDIAALYLIDQSNATQDIINNNIVTAFYKIRKIWASLPGAGYGQGERSQAFIEKWYNYFANGKSDTKNNNIIPIAIVALSLYLFLK